MVTKTLFAAAKEWRIIRTSKNHLSAYIDDLKQNKQNRKMEKRNVQIIKIFKKNSEITRKRVQKREYSFIKKASTKKALSK